MLRAMRRPAVMAGFWLFTIPALFAGVIEVLVPLRIDDLGVAGATIGAVFLVSAAVEAVISPLAGASPTASAGWDRSGWASSPPRAWRSCCRCRRARGCSRARSCSRSARSPTFWAPAMAMLSDAAEHAGLDLALAFSISNLAWAVGHFSARAWAARSRRPRQTPCPTARSPWPARPPSWADRRTGAGRPRRRARRLAAVGPGRAAALAVQLQGKPVLQPLGRVGRVAAAAEGAPGRPAELILAAVLPAG